MTPDPEFDLQSAQLADHLAQARWFAGKGRAFEVTSVESYALAPGVSTNLVRVRYTEPGGAGEPDEELYQVPLASYPQPAERLNHAVVGSWGGQHHYDAVHDREAMAVWLQAFAGDCDGSQVRFTAVGEHDLDLATHSTLFSGEQSNSSVAFGEDAMLKIFRKVHPGSNPDIEIHTVLTRSGNTHVAALFGYAETPAGPDTAPVQLAMLQQFFRTASDGWELALASVRNLVRETDLRPDEAGGDFAAEAFRLGANLAEIHAVLADAFGTTELDAEALAAAVQNRLDAAAEVIAEVAELRDALTARLSERGRPGGVLVGGSQRIHGDLHLGQTLRTSLGWKLVDFEGEPAKTMAERQAPDSCWRDVAGMIRSFGYAAATVARDLGGTESETTETAHRAESWTAHSTAAFLAGYTEQRGRPMDDHEAALLRTYVLDKAVYEALYEARNRPGWLPIPLAALAGIATGS